MGMARKNVRWTVDRARQVLTACEQSGLTARAYAAREGLDVLRLYYWRALLKQRGQKTAAFVEVRALAPTSTLLEVLLRSGHVLRIEVGFDEETLKRLLSALCESKLRDLLPDRLVTTHPDILARHHPRPVRPPAPRDEPHASSAT